MIHYLNNMMLIFFSDENGIGPEDHKQKKDACNDEEDKRIITFVVFKIAAEVVVWIDECENRATVDS